MNTVQLLHTLEELENQRFGIAIIEENEKLRNLSSDIMKRLFRKADITEIHGLQWPALEEIIAEKKDIRIALLGEKMSKAGHFPYGLYPVNAVPYFHNRNPSVITFVLSTMTNVIGRAKELGADVIMTTNDTAHLSTMRTLLDFIRKK